MLEKAHLKLIRCGVIGHPIGHSKSPMIHNHWIQKYGCNGQYDAIDIKPEELIQKIRALFDEGYAGFNITIPHKQAVMDACDDVDETARAIGAVNTLYLNEGRVIGTNTDAFGFIENVRQNTYGLDFVHHPCVVLGAGGASRAVVYALIQAGAKKIIVTNRTLEKAMRISAMDKNIVCAVPWEERVDATREAGFLVNTTALGMDGQPPLDISLRALPKSAVVCDIVYKPLETQLLKDAAARGNQCVTGIGMLLHQARPAFEKWFGILPQIDEALEKRVAG